MTCKSYLREVDNCILYQGNSCLWPCSLVNCTKTILEGWTYCELFNCSAHPPQPQPPSSKGLEIGLSIGSIFFIIIVVLIIKCVNKFRRNRPAASNQVDEQNQDDSAHQGTSRQASGWDPNFSLFSDSEDDDIENRRPIIRRLPTSFANQNYEVLSDSDEIEISN